MTSVRFRYLGTATLALGSMLASVLALPASAQEALATPSGAPHDWSHRHVIYPNPETKEEAAAKGRLGEWVKKADDPRFVLQLEKKQEEQRAMAEAAAADVADTDAGNSRKFALAAANKAATAKPRKGQSATGPEMNRDWSNVMGGAGGVGNNNSTYPAKWSFDVSSKSCADDFIVFTTNTAGATSSAAGTFYSRSGTFAGGTGVPTPGQTIAITNTLYSPAQVLTLTADATVNTGLNFAVGANATEAATNLANAIARNGGTIGVTATSAGATVTFTSITKNVAAASINTVESLSNFTLGAESGGSGAATVGQPTIFALNQLYKDTVANGGCQTSTQAVPGTFWSYNTGSGSIADLSPALSYFDGGRQVAFVQRSATNVASLVLLKWSSTVSVGTLGAPTTPTSVTPANYRSCTAPCMTVMAFSGNPNDTNSSPFVDYVNDVIYVGADNGTLHKFTGVFIGTPAEQTTGGFPATVVVGGSVMSSPVFDGTLVWIGGVADEKLHSVSSSGTVVASAQIACINGGTNFLGVSEPPIVDAGAQKLYQFVSSDVLCSNRAVIVFDTSASIAGSAGTQKNIGIQGGQDNRNRRSFMGTFDDAFYTTGTGNLYACGSGTAAGSQRFPTLWKIPITANVLGTPVQGPTIAPANSLCSPLTGIRNGSTEHLFASVSAAGTATGCTGACVYMFRLPTAASFDTTSSSSTINSNTARFISVSTSTAPNTTEATVATTLSAAQAGTYYGMTITQSAASPANTTFTYTLRKNAGSEAITCAIGPGATACSDVTNSASYVAGDTIDVRVVRSGVGAGSLTATFRAQLGWTTDTGAAAGLAATGGTSGIVVDNTVAGGGSQIYFSTLASPGLAVQASQAALQ